MGFLFKMDLGNRVIAEKIAQYPDRGLPVIDIDLKGVSLEEIHGRSKEVKYERNQLAVINNGKIEEYGGVELKGRGNTTWGQDKRPYQIKFENKVDLLGMGRARKWVLLANVVDVTSLRNDVAFMLAEMVGMDYNYRGKFVELYVDGKYKGLYYAVQRIEIAKGSVDLRGEDGVLVEMDLIHDGEGSCYTTYLGECLILKDSVKDINEGDEVMGKFLANFNKAEMAVEKGDYDELATVFDIESFAKYFLINEFSTNPDAYSSSFYMYNNDDGKIVAGPLWDFDFAFGNREWVWQVDEEFFSPSANMIRKREALGEDGLKAYSGISRLIYYLMEMPEFREEVARVFNEQMFGRSDGLMWEIEQKALENENAAVLDIGRWKHESIHSLNDAKDEYWTEVREMMLWIKTRYSHFESEYGHEAQVQRLL